MHRTFLASVAVVAGLAVMGCDKGPAVESGRADVESAEKKAAEKRAAEQRERSEEAAELERRAANLESQWTEMQTKVKTARLAPKEPVECVSVDEAAWLIRQLSLPRSPLSHEPAPGVHLRRLRYARPIRGTSHLR